MRIQRLRPERGFSLIELLIIVAVVAILALFVGPAIQRFTLRAKMRSSANTLAVSLQKARLTAIQTNQNVVAEITDDGRALILWADVNGPIDGDRPDLVWNPLAGKNRLETDHVIDRVPLETNVFFGDPNGAPTSGLTAIGIRNALLLFPSGAAANPGSFNLGFRISNGTPSGNYFQIFVSPAATARAVVRKWDPDTSTWRAQREGGRPWTWTTP
jgi:prepilin-type N-terminal cleavage/methylation domain-containing protein